MNLSRDGMGLSPRIQMQRILMLVCLAGAALVACSDTPVDAPTAEVGDGGTGADPLPPGNAGRADATAPPSNVVPPKEGTGGALVRSVTQFGITWTFAADALAGQYANGDHWVVGPVAMASITPMPTGGRNGFMINPALGTKQSFDSRIRNHEYVAPPQLPVTVPGNSSIVSSISLDAAAIGDNPQIDTVAVLTVVDAAPPVGSFRPPYIGTDKRHRWNVAQLQTSRLASVPAVAGAPTLEAAERVFERPWVEMDTTWTGRYMHPIANQPGDGRAGYGREIAYAANRALLALQLDYTLDKRRVLMIRAVQCGLDVYGAAVAGANWISDGGHNVGRKLPLVVAAGLLNDPNVLEYVDAKRHFIFQEDQQTFYVTAADVGRALAVPPADAGRPHEPYIAADVGLAEWGIRHNREPMLDGRNWDAYYRTVAGSTFVGAAMVAQLMGMKSAWNWPAFFDYTDRYWGIERGQVANSANSIQVFDNAMYVAYRGK
jgi:hypothetical protein